MLRTYRGLLRALNRSLEHTPRSPIIKETPWRQKLIGRYRAHRDLTDPARIALLHKHACDCAAMLRANVNHEVELVQAGWGINRNTKEHLANVARFCGLEMPQLPNITGDVAEASRQLGEAASTSASASASVGKAQA